MMDGQLWALLLALLLVGCHSAPARDAAQEDAIDWGHFDPEAEQRKADAQAKAQAEQAKADAEAEAKAEAQRRRSTPSPLRTTPVVRGHEPPFGYTEVMRPDWALFGVGVGLFTLGYALPALAVTQSGGNAWTMQVPLIGPLLQIGYAIDTFIHEGMSPYMFGPLGAGLFGVALVTLSAVQVSGVVASIVAFTEKKPVWVRSDLAIVKAPRIGAQLRFTGSALEVVGRF
jgi:hypothetical protein